MTTAGAIAIELRRIAYVLDKKPELELQHPSLCFWEGSNKESFLRLMSVFPRPLTKKYETGLYPDLVVRHETPALNVVARISRSAVCIIKTPAREAEYECPPLLSELEEEAVSA